MTLSIPSGSVALAVDRVSTGYGDVDFTVPGEQLAEASFSQRAGKASDEGEFTLFNDDFQFTHPDSETEIDIGDRITFMTVPPDTSSGFGQQAFGEGPAGGYRSLGTFRVLDWDIIGHAPNQSDLALTVADFVFATLANRHVFTKRSGAPIAGTADAVLDRALDESAPEIDLSQVPVIDDTIDYYAQGLTARTVVDELAAYVADRTGPVVQSSAGTRLQFVPAGDLSTTFDTPRTELRFGPLSTASESDGLINNIRVSGGIDTEGNVDDAQTTHDGTATVSPGAYETVRVDSRKSELPAIELWVVGDKSEDGVRVRLQASNDAGDAPIAPSDPDSDLATGDYQTLPAGTSRWVEWELPNHDLPERRPWLIIDAEGGAGQTIGIDAATGTPAYRVRFFKPVVAELPLTRSQNRFGRVDDYVKRESLVSGEAVRDFASARLTRHGWPDVYLSDVDANSPAAHGLSVGDVVEFDRPEFRATGRFVTTKVSHTYQANSLTTSLEFTGLSTYA